MYSSLDSEWLDARIKERAENWKQKRLSSRNPALPVIDASKFSQPLSDLALALMHKVEREGPKTLSLSAVPLDTGIILRQLNQTYNLIRFINADDTRFGNSGYHQPYSFVILPLVRTMIDGFYNCTAMLDNPTPSRTFRISGYYRIRESIEADEARYSHDSTWKEYLTEARSKFELRMRVEGFTSADLDDKSNKWPLLGEYLGRPPDTPHKQIVRKLTLGFWKEYSSISHASFDGLISLFPFIASDLVPHDKREGLDEATDRHIAMHFGRAAGILLSLLTEIQHFYRFDGADIDKRLGKRWAALIPILEVRELYDFRYKDLLMEPDPASDSSAIPRP
jgi:hypothetical protein